MAWHVLIFIVGTVLAGSLSGLWGGAGRSAWYDSLVKPAWQPPSWLFGPVWTVLYILMGIAAYLVWKAPSSTLRTTALVLFVVQLILNVVWTPLFFRYELIGWALVEIIVLLAFIIATTIVFWYLDRRAAYLMLPYIAWVVFATILTSTIYTLN